MNWSKILDTELAVKACEIMDTNEARGCTYHNGWHIREMYLYLEKTNEPYDECLDWAVLFHDIVYDNQPEKEYRSADMFVKKTAFSGNGCNLTFEDRCRVVNMIYATENHICENSNQSAIIRADLHALADPVQTFRNYKLILDESMYLYKIDEKTFADNNIKFMSGLYDRVEKNMETDPNHREFYKDVKRGIVSTINLSRILKGDL